MTFLNDNVLLTLEIQFNLAFVVRQSQFSCDSSGLGTIEALPSPFGILRILSLRSNILLP